MESVRSEVELLTSSIYGDLGDDPVVSVYGYAGFVEISVTIFINGGPGDLYNTVCSYMGIPRYGLNIDHKRDSIVAWALPDDMTSILMGIKGIILV